MYWLGVDVGTGGTRALLVDEKGSVRHAFTAAHEDMRMEHPGLIGDIGGTNARFALT